MNANWFLILVTITSPNNKLLKQICNDNWITEIKKADKILNLNIKKKLWLWFNFRLSVFLCLSVSVFLLDWMLSRLATQLIFDPPVECCYFPCRAALHAVCFAWNYLNTIDFLAQRPWITTRVCPTESVRGGKAFSADMETLGLREGEWSEMQNKHRSFLLLWDPGWEVSLPSAKCGAVISHSTIIRMQS